MAVSCHKGLAECDPGNRWGPVLLRDGLPARLYRLVAHPPGWNVGSLCANRKAAVVSQWLDEGKERLKGQCNKTTITKTHSSCPESHSQSS